MPRMDDRRAADGTIIPAVGTPGVVVVTTDDQSIIGNIWFKDDAYAAQGGSDQVGVPLRSRSQCSSSGKVL